jgi:hypothetical protein
MATRMDENNIKENWTYLLIEGCSEFRRSSVSQLIEALFLMYA